MSVVPVQFYMLLHRRRLWTALQQLWAGGWGEGDGERNEEGEEKGWREEEAGDGTLHV